MACERFRGALTEVAAGALVPAAVENHLATCEACRGELASLRQGLAVADAEMAGLLSAEPSPGLAARIRQAVAEADSPPAWRFGWLWPATAAAATLLVALAAWVGRPPSPQPHVATTRPASPRAEPARVAESPGEPVLQRGIRTPGDGGEPAPSRSAGRRAVPAAPEVLVPPGEAEALLRFVALVHRERLTPPVLGAAGRPSADLAELAPLDIRPLEIVPLDPAESSGT